MWLNIYLVYVLLLEYYIDYRVFKAKLQSKCIMLQSLIGSIAAWPFHSLDDDTFSERSLHFYEVHQKDNISRILWYSDWLNNTTSAGNSIFVTNHNTTSCGRSIMQPIRLP